MKRKTYAVTMIRDWRKHRALTLEQVADRVETMTGEPTTAQTISRIERGLIAYTQPKLEAIADALGCTPADLIMRKPLQSEEFKMWSLIESLPEAKRKTAMKMIQALKEEAA